MPFLRTNSIDSGGAREESLLLLPDLLARFLLLSTTFWPCRRSFPRHDLFGSPPPLPPSEETPSGRSRTLNRNKHVFNGRIFAEMNIFPDKM